jgi:hypothetical protein
MNTTIDRDDQETTLQSSHREWAEAWERERQDRDEQAVEQFLRLKLLQSTSPTSRTVAGRLKQNAQLRP